MTFIQKTSLVFSFFTLFSAASWAAIPANEANQLMTRSGYVEQMKQIPDMFEGMMGAQLQQLGDDIDADDLQTILGMVRESYQAKIVVTSAEEVLAEKLNEDEAQALKTWFNTPLGKKISRLEVEASTAEAQQDMQMNAATLMANQKRLAFAKRVEKLINATDGALATLRYASLAGMSATSAMQPEDKRPGMEFLEAQIDSQLPAIRVQIEQAMWLNLVYPYRSLTDAELEAYENFLKTPAALKYNTLLVNDLYDHLGEQTKAFFQRLVTFFQAKG